MFSRNGLCFVCFSCALILILAHSAAAGIVKDTYWTNAGGGSWNASGNWDNGVPDSTTAAIFNLGELSAYTVSFAASAQAGEMRVRSGEIIFNLSGQTLDVVDLLFVGYDVGDDAHLQLVNGSLTSAWADVGHYTGTGGAPG
ncbi:MAG: hypothetical protein SVV80_10935, partial [Planctomycetota bacterium]|nr:hypothetical protein [Planctomycetota bacterium]